jgi:hypothetical protein
VIDLLFFGGLCDGHRFILERIMLLDFIHHLVFQEQTTKAQNTPSSESYKDLFFFGGLRNCHRFILFWWAT